VTLRWKMPVGRTTLVRLDEQPVEPDQSPVRVVDPDVVQLSVPPHALTSLRVEPEDAHSPSS
jgi:hypothetical protein